MLQRIPIVVVGNWCSITQKGASMKTHAQVALVTVLASFFASGCAGPQKAVDQHFAKGAVGQKYSDLISTSGLKVRVDFGKAAASEPLGEGATLYVHVKEFESSSSTWLGIWGSREYSYKVTGFKVKDDVVQDWAYGLFSPQNKASLLFGFEYGYDHDAAVAGIKKDYPNIMKTSTEETIAAWKK
jgi:hypothetical protein